MSKNGVNIAVIGGGTGSFTLLSSLKNYTKNISALVNMADDGGSTGQLRDEQGVLPPGDVRQCLVALSESDKLRDLFTYRFEGGKLEGHAFGNLFLSAIEKMTGNFAEAVEMASEVLNIIGSVHPVTLDKVTLQTRQKDGTVTTGQYRIISTEFGVHMRPEISLLPSTATLNPLAREAIMTADIVVIAPGNLYGSLAPALVVPGMADALQQTPAKKVYVCNLVTKPGQTDNFLVSDFADEIERFGGCTLDYVLYNDAKPSQELLDKYAKDNEYWVHYDEEALQAAHYQAIGGHFVSGEFTSTQSSSSSDPIAHTRSFIRHDADAIARQLMKLSLG